MGWKAIKEHYRVKHIVQVTEKGICIGSPYVHDLMIISLDGELLKGPSGTVNDDLVRYHQEMLEDPSKLRDLASAEDTFSTSIPVFTYRGAEIIEKQCEELGWPNITHDGAIMYEGMFSTDRGTVVEWAKRNCLAGVRYIRDDILPDRRARLEEMEAELARRLEDARALGIDAAELAGCPRPVNG